MKAVFAYLKKEPVMAMAVLNATIVLVVSFGAKLSTQQIAAVTGFAGAILGIGGGIVRAQVSPVATMPIDAKISIDKQEKADEAKP